MPRSKSISGNLEDRSKLGSASAQQQSCHQEGTPVRRTAPAPGQSAWMALKRSLTPREKEATTSSATPDGLAAPVMARPATT